MNATAEQFALAERFVRSWGVEGVARERFAALRRIYELERPSIEAGHYHAYLCDWPRIFTPIEAAVWAAIRQHGLRLYPQYPVGRFFVDFGDPWRRVAVECDGRAFHDPVRDAARDKALRALGWHVVRLPGRDCLLPDEHPASPMQRLVALCASQWE